MFARGAVDQLLALEALHVIALAWILLCLAILAATLRALRGPHPERVDLRQRMLCLFCAWSVFSAVCSAGAIIAGGSNGLARFGDYKWTPYLWSLFSRPLFRPPHVALLVPSPHFPAGRISIHGTLCGHRGVGRSKCSPRVHSASADGNRKLSPTTRPVSRQSGAAKWIAVRTRRLLAVPYHHATLDQRSARICSGRFPQSVSLGQQCRWYTQEPRDRRQKPPVDFVILDDRAYKISRESAVDVFGEPAREVRFQNTRILIYHGNVRHAAVSPAAMEARDDEPFTRLPLMRHVFDSLAQCTRRGHHFHQANNEHQRRSLGQRRKISGDAKLQVVRFGENAQSGGHPNGPAATCRTRPDCVGGCRIVAPKDGRSLDLKLSLVQEGVAWFFMRGATPLDIPVQLSRN